MVLLGVKDLHLLIEDTRILNGVNMEVEEGKVQAIVGPNGSGKSSLAFVIMGLQGYQDWTGEILYKGESLNGLSVSERAQKGIALAWQEPARYEGLTVESFLNASAGDEDEETVTDVLNAVGIEPESYLDRTMDSGLSGGERKKIEMASILAMEPDLVLLDEPDSGIDVESLEKIFDGIKLLKEKGSTVLLITHSAAALKQAEYAFLMGCGSIVKKGKVEEISQYFETKYVPCDHENSSGLSRGSV